jgi:hypothetical protein
MPMKELFVYLYLYGAFESRGLTGSCGPTQPSHNLFYSMLLLCVLTHRGRARELA